MVEYGEIELVVNEEFYFCWLVLEGILNVIGRGKKIILYVYSKLGR